MSAAVAAAKSHADQVSDDMSLLSKLHTAVLSSRCRLFGHMLRMVTIGALQFPRAGAMAADVFDFGRMCSDEDKAAQRLWKAMTCAAVCCAKHDRWVYVPVE